MVKAESHDLHSGYTHGLQTASELRTDIMIWPFKNTNNKPVKNELLVFNLKNKSGYYNGTALQDSDLSNVPAETIFLDLENADVTDTGIILLPSLPNLRCVDLDSTKITDKTLLELCRFPTLEEIWIEDTNITDEGFASLENLKNLIFVSVTFTNISELAMDNLEEKIPKLKIHG